MNLQKQKMIAGRLLILCVLFTVAYPAFSQTDPQAGQPKIPTVIQPSPTVAALMKFEEIPVSEYTGIPSVSIPFYSEKVADNLNLNVSLSYHPSGAAVAELAGWTGNGWSLEAGGSVSRTVKGNPDESTSVWAPGIYASAFASIYNTALFKNGVLSILNQTLNDKLMWESINPKETRYDTQYDLYQYNFMGYSGRFIVTGSGEVIQLQQDSPLKIVLLPGVSVTITNEYGYRFVFAVLETTTTVSDITTGVYQRTGQAYNSSTDAQSARVDAPFTSSFQLSQIYRENNLLASFTYSNVTETYQTTKTITLNTLPVSAAEGLLSLHPENIPVLLPQESRNQKTLSIATKKLSQISIIGKSTVNFTKLDGRSDYLSNTGTKLTDITVNDALGKKVKHFVLESSYTLFNKRLFLNRIIEYGTSDVSPSSYTFSYDRSGLLPARFSDNVDFWGYYNGATNTTSFPKSPAEGILTGADKNASPEYVTAGTLKSIQYPAGGKAILTFESNTASYQGSTQLGQKDIPENLVPDGNITVPGQGNYILPDPPVPAPGSVNPFKYIEVPFDQSVSMNISINNIQDISLAETKNFRYEFVPMKFLTPPTGPFINYSDLVADSSRSTFSISLSDIGCLDYSCTLSQILKKGYYSMRLRQKIPKVTSMTTIQYMLQFTLYSYALNQRYTNGGGVRVQKIEYTDHSDTDIIRTKRYNYQNPDDATISSGSFAFPFPKYYYSQMVNTALINATSSTCPSYSVFNLEYKTYTNYNNRNPLKTKGSDIGYRYVRVSEDQNGWVLKKFTSPIDFPEDPYVFAFPYTATRDLDYKRGLKAGETVYGQDGRILNETAYSYDYLQQLPIVGLIMQSVPGCGYSRLYDGYPSYLADVQNSASNLCFGNCGPSSSHIGFTADRPASGWAQLKEKKTTAHFYESDLDLIGNTIISKENYTYNTINKAVSILDSTDPDGVVTTTKYYYPDDVTSVSSLTGGNLVQSYLDVITLMKNATLHQTGIPIQTETYKDGQLLGVQRTLYKNWGSNQIYPEIVQIAKGTDNVENRIHYNQIDTFSGNPIEVQQENGMKTCYIWGYNKTLPVVKMDNISFSSIPAAFITDIQSASDSVNSETLLPVKLSELRSNSSLPPGVQFTTYTYFPLIGIGTVTVPSGQKTRFEYDPQRRLKAIWDQDNNQLSQYDYHFRP